jgi:hypothetical protein
MTATLRERSLRSVAHVVGTVLLLALAGCSSALRDLIETEGLEQAIVAGSAYRHVVLRSPAAGEHGSRLHLYIGGDGVPWIDGRTPSRDPTPRDLLDVRLMAADAADAAYLGRPCYFGLAKDTGCEPRVWTFARFSDEVVDSMVNVALQLIERGRYEQAVLIGYSGGGALARLMAPRIPNLVGLLTIAGNLDTAAWTEFHGYLPLVGSRNPAEAPPLDDSIVQIHAIGDQDRVVPPLVAERYSSRDSRATIWRHPDYDHVCCWLESWPTLLEDFEEALSSSSTAAD